MKFCSPIGMFVCEKESCGYAVDDGNIVNHLRRKHKLKARNAREIAEKLEASCDRQQNHPLEHRYLHNPFPNDFEVPLPALPFIPIKDIFKCIKCQGYYKGDRSRYNGHKSHCGVNADEDSNKYENVSLLKGQTLFNARRTRYFPVRVCEERTESSAERALSEREDDALEEGNEKEISTNLALELLNIPQFAARRGLSPEAAFKLSTFRSSASQQNLISLLMRYVEHFSDPENPIPLPIIEFVRIGNDSNKANFDLGIDTSSKRKYALSLTRLLAVAYNGSQESSFEVELSPDVLKALRHVLTSKHPIEKDSLKLIHIILKALLLQKPKVSHGEKLVVEELFDVCMTGYARDTASRRIRMAGPADCSLTAAAMQFFCHAVALGEYFVEPRGFSAFHGDVGEDQRREQIQSMLQIDSCTPAAFIRMVLKKTKRLASRQDPKVKFSKCSKHLHCGKVNNIEIMMNSQKIGSLGFAVREIQKSCRLILQDKLLQGYKFPTEIWDTILSFPDDISKRSPGYFFGYKNAYLKKEAASLVTHLSCASINSPVLEKKRDGEKDKWISGSGSKEWIKHCDMLTERLYILFHICSGGPPRVSEMVHCLLRNTAKNQRNVYVYNGKLALLTSYSKTSRQNETPQPVARFPDRATTQIALAYITFIKPVQDLILSADENVGFRPLDYLFFHARHPLTTGRVYDVFREVLSSLGLSLTASLYRHYFSGIAGFLMRALAGIYEENIADRQAAHSERTARTHYAGTKFDFRCFNVATITGFENASRKWQELLGLSSVLGSTSESETIRLSNKMSSQTVSELNPNSPRISVSNRKALQSPNETTRDKKTSDISTNKAPVTIDDSEGELAPLLHTSSDKKGLLRDSNKRKQVEVNFNEIFHRSKRICTGLVDLEPNERKDRDATNLDNMNIKNITNFRSDAQRVALLECCVHSLLPYYSSSTLVILPTGGGKTVCWASPALQEQACKTSDKSMSLLVIPLISLEQDMLRKLRGYGLNAYHWTDRARSDASVVICPISKVSSLEYRDFVVSQFHLGRLVRIVVDEVHLIVESRSFRDFDLVASRLRPQGVCIPLVMLSGTVPPSIVPIIRESLGANDNCFKIIRTSTSRPNISYFVRHLNAVSDEEMTAISVRSIADQLALLKQEETVIAYCLTKSAVEAICQNLAKVAKNHKIYMYHGSMSRDDREKSFKGWMQSSDSYSTAMIATSAFSCGIDYPSVRTVIHVGGSRTLLEYAQETGRAGRDGLMSNSVVLFSKEYFMRHTQTTTDNSLSNKRDGNLFGSFFSFANGKKCRRQVLESFLDGLNRGPCEIGESNCDNCLISCTFEGFTEYDEAEDPTLSAKRSSNIHGNVFKLYATQRSQEKKREALRLSLELSKLDCCVCAVSNSYVLKSHWKCFRGRCYRCMEPFCSHQSAQCNVTPKGSRQFQRCFYCGISRAQDLHVPGTFNRETCNWVAAKNLALLFWRSDAGRKALSRQAPILDPCGEDYLALGRLLCGGEKFGDNVTLLDIVSCLYEMVRQQGKST